MTLWKERILCQFLLHLDSDKGKYQELINSVHEGKSNIESLLNEFSNNKLLKNQKM
jgi:hypothetical protein